MSRPRITLREGRLELVWESAGIHKSRAVREADHDAFGDWISDYRLALAKESDPAELLSLGRKIYDWLDGDAGWMGILETASAKAADAEPFLLELTVPAKPDERFLTFLEVPWELTADEEGHLAAGPRAFCPVRRIGDAAEPPPTRNRRLTAVFMAADPRDTESHLHYEAEETAILSATRAIGMDLSVEESGCPTLLTQVLMRRRPDVLHISCHGHNEPEPVLLLEDEMGCRQPTDPSAFNAALGDMPPRLLFLSACKTSEPNRLIASFTADMIDRGLPAVLGWGGSVIDREATRFAEALYRFLADKTPLEIAVARARSALLTPEDPDGKPSRDWHLARLYLGASGGGVLCGDGVHPATAPEDRGHKEFLDVRGQRVPVAGRDEFVGRRRRLQDALRAFRQDGGAGVLIHGFGRQGKSSLAARIAHRMSDLRTVVVYGEKDETGRPLEPEKYSAPAIFSAVIETIGADHPAVAETATRFLDMLEETPAGLRDALRALMALSDAPADRPVPPFLLVIDDLEQILEEKPRQGRFHRPLPEFNETLCAVIEAFDGARAFTRCRLLITSRYEFTLRSETDQELRERLVGIHLPPMEPYEGVKQAAAKEKALGDPVADPRRTARCIEHARGNPGLQDLLFSMSLDSPDTCDMALDEMEAYVNRGEAPDEEQLQSFLAGLAVDRLLGLLSKTETDMLRASTLFEIPVPMKTFDVLGDAKHGHRLLALGLWDRYDDPVRPKGFAVAPNPLVRPALDPLKDEETLALAEALIPGLFKIWGGAEGAERPYVADCELARLGVLGQNGEVTAATTKNALKWLDKTFEYRKAAQLAQEAVALLDRKGPIPPSSLLRSAGQRCDRIGDRDTAHRFIERSVAGLKASLAVGEKMDDEEMAAALIAKGRLLVNINEPEKALTAFEEAKTFLKADSFLRPRAFTSGYIARICVDKGQVDEALELFEEILRIFEKLGDRRSRAITLGDIARIRLYKGQVDEALELHRERLLVFEKLGDRRERAATFGDIARIHLFKGQVDEALELHEKERKIYEQLGDRRSFPVALGGIARIRLLKGQVDEALELHEKERNAYEQLGDRQSRAITLGDIARIRLFKGQVDEALELHEERLLVFEQLENQRERAITLGDIARIRADKGQVDEALKLHMERLRVFEKLGDRRERAVTLWDIGQIMTMRGEPNSSLKNIGESYSILRELEDANGLSVVGETYGLMLIENGDKQTGMEILKVSSEVYRMMGHPQKARQLEGIMETAGGT